MNTEYKENLIDLITKCGEIRNINLYTSNLEEHIVRIKQEGSSIIDEVFVAFSGSISHLSLYAYLYDHKINVELDGLSFLHEQSFVEEVAKDKGKGTEEVTLEVSKFDSDMIHYVVKECREQYESNHNVTLKELEKVIFLYKEQVYENTIQKYREKYKDGIKIYNTFLDLCHFYYDEKKMKFIKQRKINTLDNYNDYVDAQTDVEFYELKYHLLTKKTKGHPAIIFWCDAISDIHMKDKTILVSVDAVKLTNTDYQHIIGIIGFNRDGELVVQGIRNEIKLHMNKNCIIHHGIYCVGHIILLQGRMKLSNKTFYVSEIMHPPRDYEDERNTEDLFLEFENDIERREIAEYEMIVKTNDKKQNWIIMHDVYLDNPTTFETLDKMFSLYVSTYPDNELPIGFIFMGNFISLKFDYNPTFNQIYMKGFEKLSVLLISKFKLILKHCYLIFIPGPNDPVPCKNSIPKQPIVNYYVKKFQQNIAASFLSSERIIFATNPCRIRHFNKKMIFFRQDIFNDLIWSSVINASDEKQSPQNILLSTLLGQSHIYPIPHDSRILKRYSCFLFMYPLPNFICLSDNTCNSFISYASDNKNDAIISNSDMCFTKKKTFTVYNVLQHEAKRYVVPL